MRCVTGGFIIHVESFPVVLSLTRCTRRKKAWSNRRKDKVSKSPIAKTRQQLMPRRRRRAGEASAKCTPPDSGVSSSCMQPFSHALTILFHGAPTSRQTYFFVLSQGEGGASRSTTISAVQRNEIKQLCTVTERGRNAEGEFGTDCMHVHALAHVPTPKP